MPTPRTNEHLQTFSAAVVTGGSSGLGKSFICLLQTGNPGLLICNLSRRNPCADLAENSAGKVQHFSCDLSRSGEIATAADQVIAAIASAAPSGRVLNSFKSHTDPWLMRQGERSVFAIIRPDGLQRI